jgi:hypothetical protein
MGKSGETYGFDHNGVLITTSRFDDQLRTLGLIEPGTSGITHIRITDPGANLQKGIKNGDSLSERPLTLMAQSALAGNRDFNVTGYRDYRGVTVLGAWLWNDQLGFALATEIDQKEALLPYIKTRNAIIWLVLLTVAIATVLAIVGGMARRRRELEMLEYQAQLEITVNKRTMQLRAQNLKLETALAEVKNLSGLLPICSHCKNIRDEQGHWHKLEPYIDERTNAEFSHGICPECATKYFPGIDITPVK